MYESARCLVPARTQGGATTDLSKAAVPGAPAAAAGARRVQKVVKGCELTTDIHGNAPSRRGSLGIRGRMLTQTRRLTNLLSSLQRRPGRQTLGQLGPWSFYSHFQPIFSLSHGRVVGHEALLRANDAEGKFVPPAQIFGSCAGLRELAWCDSLSRVVHLANFGADAPQGQWLFLNVHPQVHQLLAQRQDDGAYMREVLSHFGVRGDQLVLEVVENELTDMAAFEASMRLVREQGSLIAIDDFGAGHSNFDRVWRLQPDVVKLDRSLVARAAQERRARRVVTQMVSLLHECGALVLMEGVETEEEALLAMEADADLVQGYYFGRPQEHLVPAGYAPPQLTSLYDGLHALREQARVTHRTHLAPYQHAIGNAGVFLASGYSLDDACADFLALADAELCYLLDEEGYQIGHHVWPDDSRRATRLAYEPLRDTRGACWARRPYFRRAIEHMGKVQITRPYRTLHGNHTCVTVSYAFRRLENGENRLRVICGDMRWFDGE
jgi:EAL domain-containing protein (putative c-di-GMP-specific phosphodiesterase class I)